MASSCPYSRASCEGSRPCPVADKEITFPALENNPQSGASSIGRNVMKSGRTIDWIDKIDGCVPIDQPLKFRSMTLLRGFHKFQTQLRMFQIAHEV